MPKKLPENIDRAVKRIRKEYGHYVEAKMLRGRYRLFQATSVYNPEKGRSDKITKYLGWFTDEGLLIPANRRDPGSKEFIEREREEKERIKALEESVKSLEQKHVEESVRKRETEKHEMNILKALSMDARSTIPELEKATGIKSTAVSYHKRNLERRYNIKYTLEIDIEKFGYINYVAFADFKDKKPAYKEMKGELEKLPYVQAAMTTNGTHDMVIFLVVEATSNARATLYQLTRHAFPSYDIEWTMSPIYFSKGFVPLRDEFFDMLKDKIWTRTRARPRPGHDQITVVEYDVLKAMNRNASSDFASIDRAIGAERGRSNYAYHRLLDRGIIKRATINMENLHSKFDVLLVMDIVNMKKWEPARTELLLDVIRWNKRHSDKYSFACDIMAPKGMLALTHVFEGEDLEEASGELAGKMTGAKIDSMIITKTLIGSAENRLYDQEQTVQYEILISDYNYTQDMIRRALGN